MNTIYGNYYDKFGSTNPVTKFLMTGFLDAFFKMIKRIGQPARIIEIGCGDGSFMRRLKDHIDFRTTIFGIDPGYDVVQESRKKNPGSNFYQASIYQLPFPDDVFDLVIVPEVMEHLDDPSRGLAECRRIGRDWFIFSVPREPVWRIGNILSGRYWRTLGNTPGHVQHWSKKSFISFIHKELDIIDVASPLPWTIVLARKTG